MIRTPFAARVIAGTLALAIGLSAAIAQAPPQTDKQKAIADLEKKLADLQKELDSLKATPVAKKPLTLAEADTWRSITASSLSPDGKWYAHRVAPAQGMGQIILKQVGGDKTTTFAGGTQGAFVFSPDSKWFAISTAAATRTGPFGANTAPAPAPAPTPGAPGATAPRPTSNVTLVNLASGEKTEFEGIRSISFNGEACTHLAMRKAGDGGSDLLLRDLAAGTTLTLGNVGDFAFTKKGDWLILLIESQGSIGNGIQVRDMKTGILTAIETDKATYQNLTLTEETDAFTVLKGVEDKDYDGKVYTVLGFKSVGTKPEKVEYDWRKDKDFPKDRGISGNRAPLWTVNKDQLLFGIAEQKKKTAATPAAPAAPRPETGTPPTGGPGRQRPPGLPPGITLPGSAGASSTPGQPDLVVWHWKDERLQPMQQVQAPMDKMRTDLCGYRIADKKMIRYSDDTVRTATAAPKHQFVVGTSNKKYQLQGSLDGKQFQDVYVTNMTTGDRKLALEKARWVFTLSPTGTHLLYYMDGHYRVLDLATLKSVTITDKVETSFVDKDDDHNVDRPPVRPIGWTSDGKSVILSDDWDLWKVAIDGSGGFSLTGNGKKDGIRYGQIVQFDPELKGIDLSKPAMVTMYGERSKKSGFGKLEASGGTVVPQVWDDARVGAPSKAKNAEVYSFVKQTAIQAPDVYVASGSFANAKKMTNSNPQQENYLWSSGVKVIDYQNKSGQKLQGTLYLPANYEPGKKYPTIVYIYEKLSQETHNYVPPGSWGLNRSIYTSNGYCVFTPDIVYRINDPGLSAVECILPALDAAIATGIVDGSKVGIQGHSWGGYQTAFMVTQTDRFKAAIAGAPLTNLVSMYSSVYWNSGSANQPIFESSQGRFTGGYWEQQEAYLRNSPVFHATKVKTPLVILHNDKDGAVDFTQGVEYFNTLRRLGKSVVMLQYKGENHGLVKPENRKDYSTRMREFFDHHLMGKPAPDWWLEGVPHLKMEEHLKSRKP